MEPRGAPPDPRPRATSRPERLIVGVERGLVLTALVIGAGLVLVDPEPAVSLTRSLLLVWAGAVLLGLGLLRDLAWLALVGRAPAPAGATERAEMRICLESTLGGLVVLAGLVWTLWAPGAPRPVSRSLLVLGLALVAGFGHLTRDVIVTFRVDPAHRNLPFRS